jgi:hypothetical protein
MSIPILIEIPMMIHQVVICIVRLSRRPASFYPRSGTADPDTTLSQFRQEVEAGLITKSRVASTPRAALGIPSILVCNAKVRDSRVRAQFL